jgi:hypothetical protein
MPGERERCDYAVVEITKAECKKIIKTGYFDKRTKGAEHENTLSKSGNPVYLQKERYPSLSSR